MRALNRPTPALGAHLMQTHQILAPPETHFRKATCEEVGCLNYRNGWAILTAGLDEGDLWQARNSGRRFIEQDTDAGRALVYEPGQPCFSQSEHRTRVDRPELYIARDGDWRGNPRGTAPTRFSGADAFADHLHTHLDKFEG